MRRLTHIAKVAHALGIGRLHTNAHQTQLHTHQACTMHVHLAHILCTWESPIVNSRPERAMMMVHMESEVIDGIYLLII